MALSRVGENAEEKRIQESLRAGHRWLKPVILATQEAKIGGSRFKASPGKEYQETLSQKTLRKNRAGGVTR
jgi:hypothetical protein